MENVEKHLKSLKVQSYVWLALMGVAITVIILCIVLEDLFTVFLFLIIMALLVKAFLDCKIIESLLKALQMADDVEEVCNKVIQKQGEYINAVDAVCDSLYEFIETVHDSITSLLKGKRVNKRDLILIDERLIQVINSRQKEKEEEEEATLEEKETSEDENPDEAKQE